MSSPTFDVAIIGAGPAGTSAAIAMEGSGINVILIDKCDFPRDKICGDALSPDVVNQLHKLPLDTGECFDQLTEKIHCNSVRFISPNFGFADLSLNKSNLTGYVSPRLDFDHFLFEQAQRSKHTHTITGHSVTSLIRSKNGIEIYLENDEKYSAQIVLGADGANSVVARSFRNEKLDKNHHCAGLRVYYEGVTGFSEDNAVELHFYKELLPGYFWMFPLPGNRANIGLGMLSAHVAKRKTNLKNILNDIIQNHPNVKDRFKNARPLEEIKGFGLPLGSKKRTLSGDRFLLLGDAAALINPLSGEGIANAIRSGRVAAEHLKTAFTKNDFSADFNKKYDQEIYRRMWGELQMNHWIQLAMSKPWLCNFIVKRAISNKTIQDLVLSGFDIDKVKNQMLSPSFYLDLFRK